MEFVDKPDHSGFLRKKGGHVKAYRRRYFELRGKHLYYFKAQTNKRPAGVIVLTNATVEIDPAKKFSFKIRGANLSRVYELTAESDEECSIWIRELQKAISYRPENDKEGLMQVKNEINSAKSGSKQIFGQTAANNRPVTLDDFELLCVIGRGSFGKVMKVRHRQTREVYAMKVLRKDMIIKENMVSHTKSEKQILQDMKHPFIVGLRYAFQTDEKLYLVLDFLSGGELFYHLKEETKFSVERAKFYCAEIVLAIEHLHKHDIIYRDLKPENVVLNSQGHVVLTDFGLAKTSISNATPTYTFCGTPEYLAPEILKGQGHAKAVDWWSLGILLYEMLVGLPPFYSENINEMYELILKAQLKFPNFVPLEAQSLLKGLLEREEFKRLGSGPTDGAEIRNHPFFSNIDWDKLYRKEITPPFIPNIKDDENANFDDFNYSG
jgi:serum/glucocorticoid-regulated kinase 2